MSRLYVVTAKLSSSSSEDLKPSHIHFILVNKTKSTMVHTSGHRHRTDKNEDCKTN